MCRPDAPSGRLRALAGGLGAALLVGRPGLAYASFTTAAATSSAPWSTLVVAPASGLTGAPACGPVGSLAAQVTLTWSPSGTSRLTGQVVLRRLAGIGAFTAVATLPVSATSYLDSGLPVATSYDYEIRSSVNGFFADTPLVTASTPGACL